jgi:hypothetical protein
MKVRVKGKVYEAAYVPFFRMQTHIPDAQYFKYGIRWPDGLIDTCFFDVGADQVESMKKVLIEALMNYHIYPKPSAYMHLHDIRMTENVRALFGLK